MSIGTFKTGKQEIHVSIQYFLNAELEPELIRRQVRELVAGGYDCIFGHARQGLTTPYFSEGWWRAIDAIVEECDSLGIKFAIWDEDYYPSASSKMSKSVYFAPTPKRVT